MWGSGLYVLTDVGTIKAVRLARETLVMELQTVEVRFQGEEVGSHTGSSATYTLYRVPGDLYIVHVEKGEEAWLETRGGQGLTKGQVGTFFRALADAVGLWTRKSVQPGS